MALGSLASIVQQDFSAGECPAFAPHLMPPNSAASLRNMLLDEDGSPYKRGGTSMKSNAAFGTGLRFLWDGFLAGGRRTVIASSRAFGVLAADDQTVINVGGVGMVSPLRAAVLDGILFVARQMYGGSRKTAAVSAGTVSVTEGSTAVSGAATSWTTNADAGMLLLVSGSSEIYAVKSVLDDTHLELGKPWAGDTAAGKDYQLAPVMTVPESYRSADIYAVASNRLVTCEGSRAYLSAIDNPSSWVDQDDLPTYHEVPGAAMLGAEALQDQLLLFTSKGLWIVTNVAYDQVDDFGDVQQQLQPLSPDLVLWSRQGVTGWQNSLVVPAIDGVWLVTLGRPPELLSRSIASKYVGYVTAGYKTGIGVVYKAHYLLPILDSTGAVIDLLVCRLDRRIRTQHGDVWPWSHFADAGAGMAALAVRVGSGDREPLLLGAEAGSGARIVQFPDFAPDGTEADHDGSAFTWTVLTRDIATGPLNRNLVKKIAARYELVAGDTGTPTIEAAYGTENRPAIPPGIKWDEFVWDEATWTDETPPDDLTTLVGVGPVDTGDAPHSWQINRRVRYLRVRLQSSLPAKRAVVRSLEVFLRPSGRP